MSRFSEIAQIYDHRIPQLRSPEVWEQTLRMTSSFWRLNFCEAMLLTLQNPKAEMCGTIDQWNNIGRYIRRGEHSTAVFRIRTDTQLMYLFDVRQTYGKAYNSKWKLSDCVCQEKNEPLAKKKMSHLVTEKNIATCVENKSKVETHIAPLQRERSD